MSALAQVTPISGLAKLEAGKERAAALLNAHHTDTGNAERLVYLHGDRIRYVHDARRWHVWNGTCWAPDRRGEAARLAKETATLTLATAVELPASEDRQKTLSWAMQSENSAKIEAALKVAQSHKDVAAGPRISIATPGA